ncbi:MAG: MFS transporter [Pirellulales bacterium]|nr:MFS transporter [Pirellulales bacterium]
MTTSPDPAPAAPRYNMKYVWSISLAAALGGLMFGYDWIVIGGTKPFYERYFQLDTSWEEGWAMASALLGCLIGAVLSGMLSDHFGRKRLLIAAAFVFVVSALGTALVGEFGAFNAWRIAGGVAIGLASNLSPMYIAEVAPAAVRGRLVAANQLLIVIGILLAQVVNYGIDQIARDIDRRMLAESPAAEAGWDPARVAGELAWQIEKREERPRFIADFIRLAAERKEKLDHRGAVAIVAEIFKNKKNIPVNADDPDTKQVLEVVGRGMVPLNVAGGWRWMFGVTALPACLFFVLMFFVPESPRWLVKNGRSDEARSVLARIGGREFAESETAGIEETLVGEIEKVNFRDLLEPKLLWIVSVGAVFAILQQWCGMNVIFYYAADLFAAAGYTVSAALFNIVCIGAVNLTFTIVALGCVDRFGRRVLMLIGFAALAVLHLLIGGGYVVGFTGLFVLVLMLVAIGVYGLSLAPVTWVVLSEIFPNRIRGAAMSISVFSLWSACFILTFTFPLLKEAIGPGCTFWIYGAICVAGVAFTARCLPETKGKSLEQIEKELVD